MMAHSLLRIRLLDPQPDSKEKTSVKHPYLALLISFALLISTAQSSSHAQSNVQTQPPTSQSLSPQAEKVKQQTVKLGVGKDATVIMMDKSEYYGAIKSVEADRFLLLQVDSKQLIEFRYDKVKKVRKGYGEKGFAGKRVNPRTDLIAGAALIGGIILLVWLTVAGSR
jgi:hypothetical protein